MTQATDFQAALKIILDLTGGVGELKGQMREVVHSTNNNTQVLNSLATSLGKIEALPAEVAELDARITVLETAEHKRSGAMGFGNWLLNSPMLGWLATAAVALWAYFQGKHP